MTKGVELLEGFSFTFTGDILAEDLRGVLETMQAKVLVNGIVVAEPLLIRLPSYRDHTGHVVLLDLCRPVKEGDEVTATLETSREPYITKGPIDILAAMSCRGTVEIDLPDLTKGSTPTPAPDECEPKRK